jgi:hypothetical protein
MWFKLEFHSLFHHGHHSLLSCCGNCANIRTGRVKVSRIRGYSTLTPNSLKLSAKALKGRPTTLL